MKAIVSEKGQVTIPKAMREHLNAVIEGLQAHGLPEDK